METELKTAFIKSLHDIPGVDATALAAALDSSPATAIRLNSRKRVAHPLYPEMSPVAWCEAGFYLPERPLFTLNPLLHAGAFYVQDPSSMIYSGIISALTPLLDTRTPKVLDFCAAPGGKTTAMINALPEGSQVVANEFVAARGKVLRENLEKWGYPGVITTGASSATFSRLGPTFDIIAVDAPCSGEGMMRKDEEARRQWNPGLVEQCASLQREILTDIATALRPGGFLIYSTCTFNIHEDEENARFIADNLGLTPVKIESLSLQGAEGIARAATLPGETPVEALRFMPHITEGEGLFCSIFRKGEGDGINGSDGIDGRNGINGRNGRKTKGKKGGAAEALTAEMCSELAGWFDPSPAMTFSELAGTVRALPASMTPLKEKLTDAGILITGAGLPAAELKGRMLIPDSRLPLSGAYRRGAFPEADLDRESALRFLRRESFPLPADNIPKGYVVITYEGIPLGMMKNLGQRANNLLPSSWRILK